MPLIGPMTRAARSHRAASSGGSSNAAPCGLVEDHLDLPARSGHHTDPRSCRPTRRLAAGQNFSHLIERRDLDTVMPRDQRREHATIACYPAGMTNHGFTRKGAAANLERDHRLADPAARSSAAVKPSTFRTELDEQRDHRCPDRRSGTRRTDRWCDRFVARRNQVAEAEATTVAQHANCDRPALSDQRDVAPGDCRRAEFWRYRVLSIAGLNTPMQLDPHSAIPCRRASVATVERIGGSSPASSRIAPYTTPPPTPFAAACCTTSGNALASTQNATASISTGTSARLRKHLTPSTVSLLG